MKIYLKLFSDASSDLTNSFKNNQQSVGKLQPIEQTTTLATTTTTIITTGSIQESEEERTTNIADKINYKNHKINPSI
jgi:ribosome maturation protein Sdo1